MKHWQQTTSGLVGLGLWAFMSIGASGAWGQSMPKIKPGQPYPEIRQDLLSRGWILVPNSDRAANPSNALERYLFKQGYVELMQCVNSGVDLCAFQFVNRKGHILEISTVHLPVTLDGTIQAWVKRKPAK